MRLKLFALSLALAFLTLIFVWQVKTSANCGDTQNKSAPDSFTGECGGIGTTTQTTKTVIG